MASIAALRKDLLGKHASNQIEAMTSLVKQLLSAVASLPRMAARGSDSEDMRALAVLLWNDAVAWSEGSLAALEVQVWVRHSACELFRKTVMSEGEEEVVLITMLGFDTRVAKLYSGMRNFDMAEVFFSHARSTEEQLARQFPHSKDFEEKRALHSFSLLLWQSEMLGARKQFDVALLLLSKAKELLSRLPEHVEVFSDLCHDTAAALVKVDNRLAEAKQWLTLAIEAQSLLPQRNKQAESRLLRLLSKCLIGLGESLEAALARVQLANQLAAEPSGYLVECEIYLRMNMGPKALECFKSLLALPPPDVDRGLAAVQLFVDLKYVAEAADAYRLLVEQLKLPTANPSDLSKAQVARFSWLLSSQENLAVSLLEELIADNQSGAAKLSADAINDLLALIWNCGVDLYSSKEYFRAHAWFSKCLLLSPPSNVPKRAKSLRLIARCLLAAGNAGEALPVAQQAAALDSQHLPSQWLLLQVLTKLGRADEAIAVLHRLSSDSSAVLEMAAQASLDAQQSEVTVVALELLLKQMKIDSKAEVSQHVPQLTAALVRLYAAIHDPVFADATSASKILELVKLAVDRLHAFAKWYPQLISSSPEVEWLTTYAWNVGVEAAKVEQTAFAGELFLRAQELLALLHQDVENIDRQRACLVNYLLASTDELDPRRGPELTRYIGICRQLSSRVAALRTEMPSDDQANNLMFYLELKVKAALGESGLSVVQAAAASRNPSTNLFLLMSQATKEPEAIREAYKHALRLLREVAPVDAVKSSKLICRLVDLSSKREESLPYFDDAIKLLASNVPLPADTVRWLTLAAYNNGAYFTSLKRTSAAERWMAKAVTLVKYLNDKPFELDVNSAYEKICKGLPAGAKA